MKKPFKVFSSTAMITVLASSALVPTIVANAEEQVSLEGVVVNVNGNLIKVSYADYENALFGDNSLSEYILDENGSLNPSSLSTIKVGGKYFSLDTYLDVLFDNPGASIDTVFGKLVVDKASEALTPEQVAGFGEYVNGEIIPPSEVPDQELFEVVEIAAINKTEVTVTFPSDAGVTAEGLNGKTLTLTAGESTLSATYKADSFVEGETATTATFTVDGALVTGSEYTVTSENLVIGENDKFTYTKSALETAVEAAETAIEGLLPVAEITEIDRVDIEEARALVTAASALGENVVISNIDKLVAAEAALEALAPSVKDVKANVNNNTKEITVTANLSNIDPTIEVISVQLKQLDEEGDLQDLAPKVEKLNLDEESVDENGLLTTTLDVTDVENGNYVVVVTAGDVQQVTTNVTLDFTAVDAKVDTVNKAANEIALQQALTAGGFKDVNPANITEYRLVLGTGTTVFKTVTLIQNQIDTVNDNEANKTLAQDLKDLSTTGTQQALLDALNAAKFSGVEVSNIKEYQDYLKGATNIPGTTEKSDIQEKITLINAEAVFSKADKALTDALAKLSPAADATQKDVDAAVLALETAEAALADVTELDAGTSKTITAVTPQVTIDTAQDAINDAKDAAQALADAKVAAKTAQSEFVKAGGKKGAAVYTALTTAITEAEEASDLTAPTAAVTDATTAIGVYNTAVTEANTAIDAHVAAGGATDDTEAAALATAITENPIVWTEAALAGDLTTKTDSITTATTALTDETAKLTAVTDAKEAAETAMAEFVEAGGDIVDGAYIAVEEAAEILEFADIDALGDLVDTLDLKTVELVAVNAINAAVTSEDAVALQNIIVKLGNDDFNSLVKGQRAEIGAFMIKESKEEGYVAVESTSDFEGAVEAAIVSYLADIADFNAKANVVIAPEGVTAAQKNALVAAIEKVVDLEGLNPTQKLNLAEDIFASKPDAPGYAVKTIAAIQALVSASPLSL
ncbi:hypothetical protein DVB69_05160 [Sporosarcina sp. BI001-red]|uniref:hypothetical protein n=1 Tax=Sporosarcina sp. BI001-red TaxID=2282866 RepID=UPI000E25140A|nr:hypothetical protein [Sporosarcina sp. BI001-red]REB08532.1 hypothetical protein DVB69_05160 [Sporosarcina sp. BI001-red]